MGTNKTKYTEFNLCFVFTLYVFSSLRAYLILIWDHKSTENPYERTWEWICAMRLSNFLFSSKVLRILSSTHCAGNSYADISLKADHSLSK